MSLDVTGADRHVVAIKALPNPAASFTNHHAILHVCTNNDYFRKHLIPKPCSKDVGDAGLSPLGELNSGCSSLMWIWAIGGHNFVMPPDVGFRIGNGPNAVSHVVLEVSGSCLDPAQIPPRSHLSDHARSAELPL